MKNILLGLALIAPLALGSCLKASKPMANERKAEKSAEQAADKKHEIAEKKAETRTEADKKMAELRREEFVTEANRELDRIDQNLRTLKAKAESKSGAVKDSANREIGVLQKRFDLLRDEVKDVKTNAELELETARAKFQSSLRDLEKSYNDLAARAG